MQAGVVGDQAPSKDALRRLLVWLALHGFSAGFGYLLTPYAGIGDVAIICQLIGVDVGIGARALLLLVAGAGPPWTGWLRAALFIPFAEPGE